MSLLRTFLAAIQVGLFRQIRRAEVAFDIAARHGDRVRRQVGRVGTHIGDVTRLIQTLGHHHGFLYAEAQARTRSLLQRGRNKGRIGARAGRLVFTFGNLVGRLFQQCQGRISLGLVARAEGLAVLLDDLKAHAFGLGGVQFGVNLPELLRHESTNLALAINNQLYGYRLHPTGRQATGDLLP